MQHSLKNNRFEYYAKVIILGLVVGVGVQLVFAWSGPTQSPPNGNVAGPITTSAVQQTKSGTLVLGTDLAVSRNAVLGQYITTSNASGLCLSGDCRTAWPAGSTISSVNGSGGITVSPTTGNVVISANTSVLQARVTGTCPSGQAVQLINADGTVSCQSTGGSINSISGGSGISISPTTGAVVVTADANYMQRRVLNTCPAGQSIRAIAADGSVTCEVDDSGGAVNAVTAGTGMVVSPTTGTVVVSADTSYMQRRIASSCSAGESVRAIAADGTVTCEVDDVGGAVDSITGGTGITVSQTTGAVTVSSDIASIRTAIFSGLSGPTACDNPKGGAQDVYCSLGTHNMCFLTYVWSSDGSNDVNGFGCRVYNDGSEWVIRAFENGGNRTYCEAQCI